MPRQSMAPKSDPWMPIRCVACGGENVHLESVTVTQGPKLIEITRQGPNELDRIRTGERGSIVEVRFWSECGHRFAQRFSFHKGMTFVDFDEAVDWVHEEGPPGELWRD